MAALERVGAELGRKEKVHLLEKKSVSLMVRNLKILYHFFLTAPARVGAELGRKETIVFWQQMSVSLESGSQSKQNSAICWPLQSESGPSPAGNKNVMFGICVRGESCMQNFRPFSTKFHAAGANKGVEVLDAAPRAKAISSFHWRQR